MNAHKIEELVKDIRVDACELFDIHHPLLDSGFQPSKDIIQLCDEILIILKNQYHPLGQEPVNQQCLSCGLNCPNDCPLDKEPIMKNCTTCRKGRTCDLPMDCQGRQWEVGDL